MKEQNNSQKPESDGELLTELLAEYKPPPAVRHLCACGCGEEVLEGTQIIAGHEPQVLPPAPMTKIIRTPDKPLPRPRADERCNCGKQLRHAGRCQGTRIVKTGPFRVADRTPPRVEVEDRFITVEELRRGLKMLDEGKSYSYIARSFKLSYNHVYHHMRLATRDGIEEWQRNNSDGDGQVSMQVEVTHEKKTVRKKTTSMTINKRVPAEIVVNRKAVILMPDVKPTTQVKVTPLLAQAIWDSISKEERYDIMGVDDLWDSFDDDMRMSTVSKVLVVYPQL